MSNLAYGTLTITNLSEVTSVDVWYCKSSSPTQLTNNNWQTTTPTWEEGYYIWSKTVTTWAENDTPTESRPVCITGQRGNTGNTGQSVVSITQQYALSTDNQNAPTTGWSNAMPAFQTGKYYWTRSEIVWANPTNTTHTTAVLANGITSANTTAASAVSTANSANSKADTAISTANSANQQAQRATSIANGKNTIYYSSSFPIGGTYKQGDTLFKEGASGYVIYEYNQTDHQWVKKSLDEDGITQITNAKIANLDGGKINAGTITALKLATDAIKSRDYVAGTAPYSGAGTLLDLTHGNIFTKNFGVNNTTDNIANGAYIKGSIQAYEGRIGSNTNNYWYIGDYYDYGQNSSAYIKGNGTATIQLGDSNAWRLNTNRIHTAWNDDVNSTVGQLHYLSFNSKYWDLGFHVPSSLSDKFIYIRKSKTNGQSNELELLQDNLDDNLDGTNNYWNYQFYVTSDGSVYAKNIYIVDENGNTTQVGGVDGDYLLKSGGTITGSLTVNGTLTATASQANALTHTLSINGQSWTGSSNLTINTLGTAYGGTGNTSYTTGGIIYVDGSNPKKLLSTAAGTSDYLLKSGGAGAPTWVDPGTLTVAAAAKDGDGNVIKTTYLKLTGGNVTGPVSFGDSVSIDDLNAGMLVVTGNASFTNNIQANTINGVTVGSSPKFTDTVTTISTEGNGNAITAIESTNGTLKAIKGATFLMSINSSQIISALGYTPYNATNPNGYTTNTGTVTSVQVQANSPLQSSVNTAQNSSLNTTISFVNQNANVVLAGPSSGSAAAPTFRALVAADIPTLTKSKISDFPTTWALSSITEADDLKAIEDLEGTSGLLKKTAANTWTLDTSAYVTSSGVTSITLTQGTGISIGSSGTAITSTGTRTIALADNYGDTKNPYASKTARYVLAAPAAAAGVPSFRALTNSDVGLSNVLNIKQVTGIGQGDNGKIRVFKGTGTNDYEDIAVEIVATSTSSVASSQKLTSYGGSATQPVYFPVDGANAGKPIAISYTIEKSVPSNAIFTDTWNKVSTSQDGYVTKLPGNTTTFLRGDGTWGTPDGTYSLPLAANGTRGGVQIGYTTSGKNYAVQLSSQKMYVNVPWTDTTYSAGTGLSLNGTTFSNSGVTGVKGNNEGSYHTGQVNLTPANIGAFENLSYQRGTTEVGVRPLIDQARANRLAFLPADQIIIEKTTDGGTTWEDAEISDDQKRSLFVNGTSILIPLLNGAKSTQCGIRITITGMKYDVPQNTPETQKYNYWNDNYVKSQERYFNVREWWFWISANNDTIKPEIYCSTGANPNNWSTVFNRDFGMTGWSGSDWIRAGDGKTFGGNVTQTGNYWNWRLIFWSKFADGKTAFNSATAQTLCTIKCYGDSVWNGSNSLATRDHLYSWDNNQNATFPAKVTATEFIGNLAWSKVTSKPTTLSGYGITDSILKWQASTTAATNVYDFGVYVAQGTGGATGPTNGNYYTMLNIPYRKASGNTKADYGWSIAGSTSNDNRLFYRTSNADTWGDWVEVAHINVGTAVGNATQPVYVTNTGVVTACTSYANASVNYATSAGSATSATKTGNSAIWLYANNNNEINFGGTNTGTLIYMGYRATDSRPIPTKFIFGGSSGTADLQAKTVYLGSGTSSYITSTQYTGNAATATAATKATQDGSGNVITAKYVTIDTEQTILGRKTFNDLAAVTFKPSSGTDNCSINYDSTLGALVFSF